MRRFVLSLVAAGVVAAVSVVPAAIAGKPFSGSAYQSSAHTETCKDGDDTVGTITYNGPVKMWPPNHKYVNTTVVATSSNPEDEVTLNSSVTNSQYDGSAEQNGAGHTFDDVKIDPRDGSQIQTGQGNVTAESTDTGSVTHDISLRSERAGSISDGRTYTLTETATFGEQECQKTFTVTVPHDMRPSNR